MNTSKSLKDVVWQIYWHGFNHKAAPGTTVPFDPEDYVAAIVEAVEGIYGDSDGLREFAGLPSNQVVNPSPKQTKGAK